MMPVRSRPLQRLFFLVFFAFMFYLLIDAICALESDVCVCVLDYFWLKPYWLTTQAYNRIDEWRLGLSGPIWLNQGKCNLVWKRKIELFSFISLSWEVLWQMVEIDVVWFLVFQCIAPLTPVSSASCLFVQTLECICSCSVLSLISSNTHVNTETHLNHVTEHATPPPMDADKTAMGWVNLNTANPIIFVFSFIFFLCIALFGFVVLSCVLPTHTNSNIFSKMWFSIAKLCHLLKTSPVGSGSSTNACGD